jgi:hypothetical protein
MNATGIEKLALVEWAVANRALEGQTVSGDLHVVKSFGYGVLLAAIDGVGHGEEAASAACAAAEVLKKNAAESVISLAKRCHEGIAKTRGVVMTLASVNALDNTVTWLGIGNVEGRLLRAESDGSHPCEHVLLRNGLVGLQLPPLHAGVLPLSPGDILVFATDGIHAGFDQEINPAESIKQIADHIMERHFKGTDDALVLVSRYAGITHE